MSLSIRGLFKRGDPEVPASDGDRQLAQKLVACGVAAEKSGSPARAMQCYRDAIKADPNFASAHMGLGIGLQAAGETAAAIASYEQAIALDPEYAKAHYNLALAHLHLREYTLAERSFRAALRFQKAFPEAWVGLADALEGLGQDEDALAALDCAIAQRGEYAGALFNASLLSRKMGRLDAAVEYDRRALELEPENFRAHYNLGTVLHSLNRLSEAEASYRNALAFKPDFTEAQVNLAAVLGKDRKAESLQLLFDVVASQSENADARRILVEALLGVTLDSAGEKERNILLSLCMDDNVSMHFIKAAILGLLKKTDAFHRLRNSARHGGDPFALRTPELEAFLRDRLLLAALPRMPIADGAMEEVLTHMRRWILLRFAAMSGSHWFDPVVPADFVCAMARQCFFSGYAFFANEEELRQVAIVRETVQSALEKPLVDFRTLEPALTITALYDSLHTLRGNERLLEQPATDWSEAFQPVVQEQLGNRRRERQIAEKLSAITSIEDPISLAVRGQYEENPYPIWASVHSPRPSTIENLTHRFFPDQPARAHPRPVRMLIAGCGTGQHPILVARAYPECEILAVDLSLASLSYAARMTERFGVSNITYRQADILKLGEFDERFAVIECSGVLHHLDDPMEGWRILVNLMEPDGLIKIALYSEKARSGLRATTQFIESLDLPGTPHGIRCCRHAIMGLPDGHPAKEAMTFGDFFTLNGCRDLLMHVREHQFTLPRIADCISHLGLRFLGMECSAETLHRFQEMFPDSTATDLDAWDRFENACPQTFKEMYFFWCCKAKPVPALSVRL